MNQIRSFLHVLGQLGARRALLLVLALSFNSLLEGFGIATLVPLVVLALGQDSGAMPPIATYILSVLDALGLPREAWMLALIASGALVAREILSFAILTATGFVITDIEAKLRQRLFNAIVRARWTWFHDQQLGDMAISLAEFTSSAAAAMDRTVKALALLIRTITYLVLIVLVSPVLAALVAILALFLFAPLFLLLKLTRKYSTRYAGGAAALSASFADVFASVKTIKAMGLEHGVRPFFERFIRRMRKAKKRMLATSLGLTSLQNIIGIVLIFSALYMAINWVGVSIVEVSMVAGLVVSVARNLSKTQALMQKVAELAPYLAKIENLMRSAREAREDPGGGGEPVFRNAIRFQKVSFSHPGKPILQQADFTIPLGALTVVKGPSGIGKSTLVDLIIGLRTPDEGAILVDGTPLTALDLRRWRHMIGYVPQELILLSGTVRDNITLGARFSDEDIWRALELAGAADFVRELPDGLDAELGERGVKLSGGQRQRLSLARALVRQPKLLILDEVTSALDPETEKALVQQIANLAQRRDITVIAITHTPAWTQVADQVLELSANGLEMLSAGTGRRSHSAGKAQDGRT